MAIEFKDYYRILGVASSAHEEDIRKAFRKLARLYHPDIAHDDRRAEDRFKEINEAYEVLGDPEKRKLYDDFNARWSAQDFRIPPGWEEFRNPGGSASGRSDHFTFTGTGFSDFFDQLFGPNAKNRFTPPPPPVEESRPEEMRSNEVTADGDDLEADIWVTLEEVARGAVRPITMRRAVRCPKCFGVGQYNSHKCDTCAGSGNTERLDRYKVKIPAGVLEGTCLRVAGQGEQSLPNSTPGDLYLKVCYTAHPEFRLEGGQLTCDLELAPWEAVLGATLTVPTLYGEVSIKVPPGTQTGHKLRVRGKGLPDPSMEHADLFVRVKIQVPDKTESRERELWQELARESHFCPRN